MHFVALATAFLTILVKIQIIFLRVPVKNLLSQRDEDFF